MTEDGEYRHFSSAIRYRVTTVLVERETRLRAAPVNEILDSVIVGTTGKELSDERLFRTAVLECSKSGTLRIVFGLAFFVLFAIARAS